MGYGMVASCDISDGEREREGGVIIFCIARFFRRCIPFCNALQYKQYHFPLAKKIKLIKVLYF